MDITTNPPSHAKLERFINASGLEIKKCFNTSGVVYREMKLKEKLPSMSATEMIKLLASNGKLLKRPIVTDETQCTIGFKEEEFERIWA